VVATRYENIDVVEYLLDMGADINIQNDGGETSLYIACRYNISLDILLLLLTREAEINKVIRFGSTTVLQSAIQNNRYLDKVKILLEYGADPNLGDKDNNRPLQYAALVNADMVKILLEYGADINGINVRNITALFYACLKKNTNNINILLEYGADPFILDVENMNIFNNNMLDMDIKILVKEKINELHKLNTSYNMLEIAKGIQSDPLEELTDDVLDIIYDILIDMPYNPEETRLRMIEYLQTSRFITGIEKHGGKKKKNYEKKY
jgi:FOG: Ankyrin repeat